MSNKTKGYESDPFAATDSSHVSMADALYGKPQAPDERKIVKPLPILKIYNDPTQPRRAIPAVVRGNWAGNPNQVRDLLIKWQDQVVSEVKRFSIDDMLRGGGDGFEMPDKASQVVRDYIDLCNVAGSIYRDGLINAITVRAMGATDSYLIETGERRWLAHHLLALVIKDKKFEAIPAEVVSRSDVWRQAAENGARKPLTAIGMARQLALLIMDMYQKENTGFKTYNYFVENGESDRAFYGQVSNGNVWRIKKGYAQKILDVTGLKSIPQVADYRRLLTVSDEVWQSADLENWALGRIQVQMGWRNAERDTFGIPNVSEENRSHMYDLPDDDTSDMSEVPDDDTIEISMVSEDGEERQTSKLTRDTYPSSDYLQTIGATELNGFEVGMVVQHVDGTKRFVRMLAPAGAYVYSDMETPFSPAIRAEFWDYGVMTVVETTRESDIEGAIPYPLFRVGELVMCGDNTVRQVTVARWDDDSARWYYRVDGRDSEVVEAYLTKVKPAPSQDVTPASVAWEKTPVDTGDSDNDFSDNPVDKPMFQIGQLVEVIGRDKVHKVTGARWSNAVMEWLYRLTDTQHEYSQDQLMRSTLPSAPVDRQARMTDAEKDAVLRSMMGDAPTPQAASHKALHQTPLAMNLKHESLPAMRRLLIAWTQSGATSEELKSSALWVLQINEARLDGYDIESVQRDVSKHYDTIVGELLGITEALKAVMDNAVDTFNELHGLTE